MTSIELLSPARNLACGLAAVNHGADAVYIGASRFGARQAAGNSVEDIATLCDYAHRFGVRVYVTLNTILYDEELSATEQLAWALYEAGVDAFIVQDMSLLRMKMPPVPLHASTQMDNRTPLKVQWLRHLGFQQVVLARELSLQEIAAIHQQVPEVCIEAFVHGALCVSYSGRCNASQYCFGRSANRGECAQFCRLPYDLVDGEGRVLVRDKHLLSLRDMNRSESLEEMIDAGVRSFKIEGRLKDEAYVRNVTAYYRQRLDRILARRPDLQRTSVGTSAFTFTPDLDQSFSRGYTDYFLHGRTADLASWDTPKSIGPEVGYVKEIRGGCLVVAGTATFSNGDGLCYKDATGKIQGFRINRAEGNHLYPATMPPLRKGDTLWRSHDQAWDRMMEGPTASRHIRLSWTLDETPDGFSLRAETEDGRTSILTFPAEHQPARTPQDESIRQVLSKLGDTDYEMERLTISFTQPWFIPRSVLAEWRRKVIEAVAPHPNPLNQKERRSVYSKEDGTSLNGYILPPSMEGGGRVFPPFPFRESKEMVSGGESFFFSNHLCRSFYEDAGVTNLQPAYELQPDPETPLMTCRYCIRHALGWCTKDAATTHERVPKELFLVSKDGRKFRLHFNCKRCEMTLEQL